MPLPTPIPLVLLGLRAEIGHAVSKFLRPEYETIYFISSPEVAKSELPKLLAGKEPARATNDVGTENFTQPPRVLMFGRGYTPEFVQELKRSLEGVAQEPVAWAVGDPAKAPTGPPGPDYVEQVAKDSKAAVATWAEEGGTKEAFVVY
ncbi:hypothetical protein BJY01DRAFT_108015 [Aspergillus pseudoustus]|uniref:NAD(P)-binding domain-containing protein n=1 Tax=Aspergillus pseudoustus TaxID=1810923 RepID=A0ABR4IXP5_9EURO